MDKNLIDISGLDKADVLRLLYNSAKTQGMGVLHFTPENMTYEAAQDLLDRGQTYFDYVQGRVMKVRLAGDNLDRDNGLGAALHALTPLLRNVRNREL